MADSLFNSSDETELAINYIDSIINSGHYEIAPLLERQINYLLIMGNFIKALDKNILLLEITNAELGNTHPVYALRKLQEAEIYFKLDSLSQAIESAQLALRIFENTEIYWEGRDDNNPSILDCQVALAKYYRLSNNFEEALLHIISADSIGKSCYAPDDFIISKIKFQYGLIDIALGNYESACNEFRESLDICEKNGINGSLRFSRMYALADALLKTGDYNSALKINKRITNEAGAYNDFNNLLLALGGQVEIYINERLKSDILECIQIIEKIISDNEIQDANGFLIYYYTLAGDYFFNELHYQESIDLYRKSRNLIEFPSEEFSIISGKIANSLSRLGDIASAIQLTEEELNNRISLYGEYSPLTANSLNNLGLFYEDLGQIDKAKYYAQRAFIIRDSILPENHPQYMHSISNLAELYLQNDSIKRSIELQQRLLSIQSQYGDNQIDSQDLANLGFTYLHTDSLFKAKECFNKALAINKSLFTKKSYQYARTLSYLSRYYEHLGLPNKAFKYEKESVCIFKELYGECNEQYLSRLDRFIWLSYFTDKWKLVNINIQPYHKYLVDLTLNNLLKLDKSKREDYWEAQKSWFLNDQLLYASDKRATRKMIENAYDGLLYGKSLLLRIDNYLSLLENNDNVNNTRHLSNSLLKEMSWSDVWDNLSKNEIAIEFGSFNDGDITQYIALVIDKEHDSPSIIKLFNENEILRIDPSDYYTTNFISDLVWKPLYNLIKNKTNIYFSPYGILHTIAIESIPYGPKSDVMGDAYNFFRLTSTRELIIRQEESHMENVVLYGDIDYTLSNQDNNKCIERYSRSIRKGVSPLPATKKEINAIRNTLVNKEIIPDIFVRESATEESFKSLSGTNIQLMHIATHGFFWSDSLRLDRHKSKILNFYKKESVSNEDLSLCNSGLLFAGANNSLLGNVLRSNEDGILTAKEISNINLTGLDLVVLSACETGLGILNDDGVFGIQRGFKIAGARSLIMSLWEVDDDATQILMTEFYKHYLNGNSKRESLLAAQKVVRETSGFEDPEYWASFILLDALN